MVRKSTKPVLRATAADAVVVAIAPALIIGMVASLIFFLVVAFYRGEYDTRLMVILGLFTLATVLIARIAIDSGRAYANAFSLPLAIVSLLAMLQFVRVAGPLGPLSWLVNVGLLAVAWYLSDRITFDCTLLDEREAGQQQGLLQSLGLLRRDADAAIPPPGIGTEPKAKRRKKHNPGVWVLYFSLLAFPLFGVGQLAIPDGAQRTRAFFFLFGYLACGLGLLVTTSFLGMRRYLRQKGVAMPGEMVRTWLASGMLGVLVVLVICMLLPLPGRNFGLSNLPIEFISPDGLTTSRFGWGSEGEDERTDTGSAKTNSQQGPQSGPPEADAKGQPQASDQASDQAATASPSSGKQHDSSSTSSQSDAAQSAAGQSDAGQSEAGQSDAGQSDAGQSDAGQSDANSKQRQSPQSQAPSGGSRSNPFSNWTGSIPTLFKWLTVVVLAAIVIVYVVTHPRDFARLLRELRDLLANFFGRRAAAPSQVAAQPAGLTEAEPGMRPFHSFADPFAAQLRGWSPEQVILHTFAALEAWGFEHGNVRATNQTAAEFARQLMRRAPTLGKQPLAAAEMLDRLLFAGWKPSAKDIGPLAQLWKALGAGRS